ncbi:MAG: hypothetical protein JST16_16785 [Bdellovibrionales bacterium]|nr:hypothetical protein [Bdellovibrionales bacterium]
MSLDEDIIIEFRNESQAVLGELLNIVEKIEDDETDPALFSEFAQKIDRIMGAAKTLAMVEPDHQGLAALSHLCELCKRLGYKVAEINDPKLAPMVGGFWADVLEVIQNLLRNLSNVEQSRIIAEGFPKVLQKRLEWLTQKVGSLDVEIQPN